MSTREQQHAAIRRSRLDSKQLKLTVRYDKSSVAWFSDARGQGWLLSNLSGGMPIRFPDSEGGFLWNSSEQLFQACKYGPEVEGAPPTRAGDPDFEWNLRLRLQGQESGRGAMLTQRSAEKAGLVRPDWSDPALEVRLHAMQWVLELKLLQNQERFGRALAGTGLKPVVALFKTDDFWGCREVQGGFLSGRNVLGKLLSDLRGRMEEVKKGRLTCPQGFLLD